MTIRFKRANQISSIFITSSTDHITGYNPVGEWPAGAEGFATYSGIELQYSLAGVAAPTGIMVRAKVPGSSPNGWTFTIDQNVVHPPTVGVVGTVVTIDGDGGVTTLANVLAALLAETDVTDVWDVYTLPHYDGTDVLQAEGTDGEGPETATTIGGRDYDNDTVDAVYAKEDGIEHPFDGQIVVTDILGSFRVFWNIEHLDQEGDIELYVPAATGRDPANRYYDVKSLPDGIFWEGYVASGAGGGVITMTDDLDEAINPAGDDNTLAKSRLHVLRGTGAGQTMLITSNDASDRTLTLNALGYTVGPLDATSYVAIIPGGPVDVGAWGGTYWDTARPEVDVAKWKGGTPSNLSGSNHVQTTVAEIAADAITATAIANNAIDASAIATGAITAAKFAAGAIDAAAIASDAITAAKIASDAITAAKIATGAITAAKFAAGAIDAAAIADNAIDAGAIAADAITAAKIANGAIDFATLASDVLDVLGVVRRSTATAGAASTVTLDASASATDNTYRGQLIFLYSGTGSPQTRLITGYVGSTKVATVFPAWTTQPVNGTTFIIFAWAGQLENGAITANSFAASAITATSIATGAITAAKFAAGAIDAAAIASDAITAAKIADNAIDAGAIASDAITAAKIATGAITAAKFAAGAIDAAAIADNAIDAGAIASDAITAAKIATGAITAAKFAAGAIDAAAIASDAITAAKIAADAITAVKIATGAITAAKFAAGAIDAAAIADNAIDAGAIAANAITATKIATDAIGAAQISAAAVTKIQDGLAAATAVTAGAIATAVWDAVAASYNDAGSMGEAAQSGGATAAEVVDELFDREHDTGVTVGGLLARLEALVSGKATGLRGALARFFMRDGTTPAIEAVQDVSAGTRDEADVTGSEP